MAFQRGHNSDVKIDSSKRPRTKRNHQSNVEMDNLNLEKVYGKHSVKAVLLQRPKDVRKIVLAGKEEYHKDLISICEEMGVEVSFAEWSEFKRVGRFTEEDSHQGVFAWVVPRRIFSERDFQRLDDARCVLVLDQVSNPQNLATILRSAAFFHADAVFFMRHRSATPTSEVVRFAVGGAEFVDLYQVANIAQTIDELKDFGFKTLGLDERGQSTLADMPTSGKKIAFVIGAEGEGLRQKTKHHCDALISIPGGVPGLESLNAAVAATIALYEYGRLKKPKTG